jgi:hypothetical protein
MPTEKEDTNNAEAPQPADAQTRPPDPRWKLRASGLHGIPFEGPVTNIPIVKTPIRPRKAA